MNVKKSIVMLVLSIALLCIPQSSYTGFSQAGAIFLTIFPGARPVGMGGAFTAIADDAAATYYNQAGLAFQKQTDISYMYSKWLPALYPGMYYRFLGLVHPLKRGCIGGNIIYLTTGETEATDIYGNVLDTWRTFDVAVSICYGTRVMKDMGVVAGLKFIYSYLCPDWVVQEIFGCGGGKAYDFAVDLSMLYKTPFPGLNVGASLQNFGPDIRYVKCRESDPLPRMLRTGFSYDTGDIFKVDNILLVRFAISIDRIYSLVGDSEPPWKASGWEFTFFETFSLREGSFNDKSGHRIGDTEGYGFKSKGIVELLQLPHLLGGFEFDVSDDSDIYEFYDFFYTKRPKNLRYEISYKFESF